VLNFYFKESKEQFSSGLSSSIYQRKQLDKIDCCHHRYFLN